MPGFPTIYIKDCFEKIYFLAKGLFVFYILNVALFSPSFPPSFTKVLVHLEDALFSHQASQKVKL